jgi:hypothetical protein
LVTLNSKLKNTYIIPNKKNMSKFMPDFSKKDYAVIIEALEYKQGHYVPGDKMYNEYGEIIVEMKRRSESAVAWRA